MRSVLRLYHKCLKLPFGKWIFSQLVSRKAPYFATIKPRFVELRPGYAEVTLRKCRKVENHIRTVHAIAMANLCEIAAGLMTEVSIPNDMRWIPIGMTIKYQQKARTNLRGIAKIDMPDWQDSQDLDVPVSVLDNDNNEVVHAVITMKVSKKK